MAERFGPYRLDALLGRGGMGDVWRAYDTDQDRVVALKLLPQWLSDNEDYRARFRREARTAATLNEPHVIPIHRFGEIDGQLFLDMRIVEGDNLADVIERDGPLALDRAVAIIEQVASALDAAHAKELVHRDVKPQNVLVRHGHPEFVYLADFGIARALDSTKITLTGAFIGTPAYMAPERFTGDGDHRGDVYALGCLLYETLTGSPAFKAPHPYAYMRVHETQPPPRPSTTRPGLPNVWDDIVARALAKNPADRYPSAGALATAARAAVEQARREREAQAKRDAEERARRERETLPALPALQRSWPILGSIGAIIGISFAIIAVVASRSSESTSPYVPTSSPKPPFTVSATTTPPVALLTGLNRQLFDSLLQDDSRGGGGFDPPTCSAVSPTQDSAGAAAIIDCNTTAPALDNKVRYRLFADRAKLDTFINSIRSGQPADNKCSDTAYASTEWDVGGKNVGIFLCTTGSAGDKFIIWAPSSGLICGSAENGTYDSLYTWWSAHAISIPLS